MEGNASMPFNNCETVCFFRIGIECTRGEQKLIELMRAVQYSTVQYSTVQYSTVKYCTVRAYKYRTVRTIVQYSTYVNLLINKSCICHRCTWCIIAQCQQKVSLVLFKAL